MSLIRGVLGSGCACAYFWRKDGHDLRVGRVVGVVTIHAVVAFPSTSAEIPVSGHSTVTPIFIIAVLWAVTLGAELDDI